MAWQPVKMIDAVRACYFIAKISRVLWTSISTVMYTACLQVSASVHFHRHSRPPRFIDLLQCLSSIQQEAQLSQKKNHMALSVISSNVLTHRSHQTSDKIVTPIRCLHTFHVKLSFVSYLDIKWPFPLERRLRACWNFIIIFCLSKLRMTKLY